MSRQLIFFIVSVTLIFMFFYSVSDILLPFVSGILIAYFLDPTVERLEKLGLGRGVSSAIITLGFFAVIALITVFGVPVLYHQLEQLLAKFPEYYAKFNANILPVIKAKLAKLDPDIATSIDNNTSKIPATIGAAVGGVFKSGMKFLNFASLIMITPIVTFYILRDWNEFLKKVDSLLPRNYAPTIRQQARKIDKTIAAFIRGQLTVCLVMGLYYGTALSLLGLNFGFVIGFATGFLTFIPYVGSITGTLIGMSVAYFQFGEDYNQLALILGVFVMGQVVEGNIITPKLVGGSVGVHPAWLIFGMLAGGSLLGFTGVLISVPLTAIISVLVKFAVDEYEKSEFYKQPKPKKVAVSKTKTK